MVYLTGHDSSVSSAIAPPPARSSATPRTKPGRRELAADRCQRAERCSPLLFFLLLGQVKASSTLDMRSIQPGVSGGIWGIQNAGGFVVPAVVADCRSRLGSTGEAALSRCLQSCDWSRARKTQRTVAAAWMAVSAGLDVEIVSEQSRSVRH